MRRTQSIAALLTLLASAQAPAVFIDNFDTLSPDWRFVLGETSSQLIHEVSGGYFRASGFTPASGGPAHSKRMRRALFSEGQPGQNNLTLKSRFNLPFTNNITAVAFSISELRDFGSVRGYREVRISPFGNDHFVTVAAGGDFNSVLVSGLSGEVEIEIQNQGPVASLFLNGMFVSSVSDSFVGDRNPSYNSVEMYFEGVEGTAAPVNIDYIQVVPEPSAMAAFGVASLVAARRRRKI